MTNDTQLDKVLENLQSHAPLSPNRSQIRERFLQEARRLSDEKGASASSSWITRLSHKVNARLPRMNNRNWIPVLTCLTAIVLVASIVVAQQIFDIFRRTENDQQTIQVRYGMGDQSINRPISLEEAQGQVDFAIALPDEIPDTYQSMEIYYWEEDNTVSIHYHCGWFRELILSQTLMSTEELAQIENGDFGFLDVGASAEIASIPIGESTGQYVRGTWIVKNNTHVEHIDGKWRMVYENNGQSVIAIPGSRFPADGTWENNSELQRLYWYSDGILYLLYNIGSRIDVGTADECALDQDDYADVANSLILMND